MKRTKIVLLLAAGMIVSGSVVGAAEMPSVELGEKMFNNPGLGALQNAISCATCHPKGKGLEKAGANPRLAAMVNKCIAGPLKGEGLSEKSVAMESLLLYLKSLAQ